MGTSTSVLDCVHANDFEALKETLESEKLRLAKDQLTPEEIEAIHMDMEESLHTIVGMEISSSRQLQRLQIALELMLNAFPSLLLAHTSTECKWTSIHRICVAENLQFIEFLVGKYKRISQQRDAFGLFPVDLIAPELFLQPKPQVRHSVQLLLEGKRQQEAALLQATLARKTGFSRVNEERRDGNICSSQEVTTVLNHRDGEHSDEPDKLASNIQVGEYYVAFLDMPHIGEQQQLSASSRHFVALDRVWKHDADTPLLLAYRLPRVEEFMSGYFQLIWRSCDEPRFEEPHYDLHYMLREEIQDVEVQEGVMMDAVVDVETYRKQSQDWREDEEIGGDVNVSSDAIICRERVRSLHEELSDVLEGTLPIEVSHLPHEATAHVLFVACDKHMMRRRVELSSEGICIQRRVTSDSGGENQDLAEQSEYGSYVFYVAGEEFSHSSQELAGQNFESLDEFQTFVQDLRRMKREGLQQHLESSFASSLSSPLSASQVSLASSLASNSQEHHEDGQREPTDPALFTSADHENEKKTVEKRSREHTSDPRVPFVPPRTKVDLTETIMIA